MARAEEDRDLVDLADAPAIPADTRPVRGLIGTFFQGFAPGSTAGSFATSDALRPAVVFALLTAVPLSFLQGIIPWTHRLTFTHTFHFYRNVPSTTEELVWDILRAGGIGWLVTLGTYALLAVSYVHLSHAYGHTRSGSEVSPARAALRAVLYRAWLAPMLAGAGLPAMLLVWALPQSAAPSLPIAQLLITLVPFLLLFLSLRGAARQSCGCGPFSSFTVVVVPFILMGLATTLLIGEPPGTGLLEPWLPEPPAEAR